MTLVLLDVDGPQANFSRGWLDEFGEVTGRYVMDDEIEHFGITESEFFLRAAREMGIEPGHLAAKVWSLVNRPGFCSGLKVVHGAREAVRELRKFADVECVTSPLMSSVSWMPERADWVKRHLGYSVPDHLHFVSKKARVPGDFLVDDRPEHLIEWSKACVAQHHKGLPILWDASYNRDLSGEKVAEARGFFRATSWTEVVQYVREFAGGSGL